MKYDYDLVVIGGGAAGLVAATGGASLGAKTALIERDKLGGDCTLHGCVPSKTLLRSSYVYSLVKRLEDFGISPLKDVKYDTSEVMSHVRGMVKRIESHHPPEVFEERGIKVLFGDPKFIDANTIVLDGERIRAKRYIICTGSHPMIPPIEGLGSIEYLTNENIFDLKEVPESLVVLGGGAIGAELSQAFSRLGCKVTLIEMFDRILFKDDEEVAWIVSESLSREDIEIITGMKAVKVEDSGNGVVVELKSEKGEERSVEAEKVLVATGRAPNLEGLDLEKADVKYYHTGIEVDDALRTSAKNIYAAGDVAGPYPFSHMAEYQAIIAVGNALFPFKRKVNYDAVAWCTFTYPELAHMGLTEEEARAKYKKIKIFKADYSSNDRAVTDLEETGFAKVICDKKGRILGAHIAGANAGELIHEYVLAKSAGLKIGSLSSAVHVYPTLSQVVKRTADEYYTGMLSSRGFRFLSWIMLKFLR
ncbi:dihydrolipoyl dehydrogenase family protein [Candidatus Omnitrophota bacterium]